MRAYGLALSSLSGLEAGVVDPRDGSFLGSPTFVSSDPNAASYGLLAAIAAVLDARRTGGGAHVELSQLEAAGHIGTDDDASLIELARELGLDPRLPAASTDIVSTGDGQHLCIEWEGRMAAERFVALSRLARSQNADAALDAFTVAGARGVRVIEQPAEFGAGAANEGTLLSTIHPVSGAENIVAAPWWIDGHRPPLRKTAPTLGEGNAYVLGKLLGWPYACYAGLAVAASAQGAHG